jgi:hypothetical protein
MRNYLGHMPEDYIHANRPEAQQFALSQFRSSAYNSTSTVLDLKTSSSPPTLRGPL